MASPARGPNPNTMLHTPGGNPGAGEVELLTQESDYPVTYSVAYKMIIRS